MSNGADVRERRIAAKVQQKDLAAYLGVTHQKMNAWELGRQDMPGDVFGTAVEALDCGAVPKSPSKLSVIGRKDADAGDAAMALFDDAVASMKAGALPDLADLLADNAGRAASMGVTADECAGAVAAMTGRGEGECRKTVRDAIAEVVADMTGCGVEAAYSAFDATHGHRADIADEIAAISRAAREMQSAEWDRLAGVSDAAERLGWRASMTIVDDEPEYIIEAGGRHVSVAPDDVEAFMRGAACALGRVIHDTAAGQC